MSMVSRPGPRWVVLPPPPVTSALRIFHFCVPIVAIAISCGVAIWAALNSELRPPVYAGLGLQFLLGSGALYFAPSAIRAISRRRAEAIAALAASPPDLLREILDREQCRSWRPSRRLHAAIRREACAINAGAVIVSVRPQPLPLAEYRFEPVIIRPFEPAILLPKLAWGVGIAGAIVVGKYLELPFFSELFRILLIVGAAIGLPVGLLLLLDFVRGQRYVRIVPGRIDVLRFWTFRRSPRMRSFPIAPGTSVLLAWHSAAVIARYRKKSHAANTADAADELSVIDLSNGVDVERIRFGIPIGREVDRPARAARRAILSTAETPPVSRDALLG